MFNVQRKSIKFSLLLPCNIVEKKVGLLTDCIPISITFLDAIFYRLDSIFLNIESTSTELLIKN